MSGLFSREASFLLNDGGNDRAGSSRSRGNGTQRYGGRSRRGGRGRGNYSNRGGGRNSGRSYFDRDVPDDDDGLGHEGSWSGREQRKFAPYRTSNRRPFRGRGYNSRPPYQGGSGVFSRLGQPTGGSNEGGQGGYVGRPAMAASSWSKVTVHNGAQNSKDWLLKTLSAKICASLIPVQWHVLGDKTIFFIEDQSTAMKLKQLGNLPSSGGELRVVVKPSPPPMQGRGGGEQRFTGRPGGGGQRQQQYRPQLQQQNSMEGVASMEQDNSSNEGIIMECLSKRYDPDTKGLDLSDMFHDEILKQNGIQGVMYRPDFANAVMSQIIDKCPDLISLDLSSNRLRQLDCFGAITTSLPSLQVLNLSENQINHLEELGKVASTSVVNLVLEGNSVVNSCGDIRKYSSLMREKFPNLQILDGHVLHSPVKFDLPVATSVNLPETKPSYLMNDEVQQFLKSFIEQYYNIYDNDKSREDLLTAYSSEAVFSLSVVVSERTKGPYLGEYMKRSRNIMKVYREKRESLLQHGKLDVVKALNDLPKTKHLASSFVVDVSLATPSMVVFSLWGLFAEVGHQSPVARAFSRMFVVTSSQGSVSIINDQLTVRNATPSQVQMVREALGSQLQTTSPLTTVAPAASVNSPPAGNAPQGTSFNSTASTVLTSTLMQQPPIMTGLPSLSPQMPTQPPLEQKQLLVNQLAGETGMNQQFSEKCLSQNHWQYDKAIHAFQCLKDKSALPQEAFIQ